VTTVVSYLSHSQVWAAQSGGNLLVGGTTNRAEVAFEAELGELLEGLPEVTLPAPPLTDDGAVVAGSMAGGDSSSAQ
jgi:cytochrome c biogenesis protein